MRNVVFIVLDSLRKDRLGAYNEEVDFTDNIDGFAEEASVFSDAVAQAPWTLPSHASMFTGEYPWRHGATQRNLELDTEKELLAEKFSDKGYDTACFSTNGFLNSNSGLVDGFDRVENLDLGDRFEFFDKFMDRAEEWMMQGENRLKKKLLRIGDRIFHYWNSEMRETEEILERGEDFIEDSENFFLFMNLMDAHEPYFPPREYLQEHGATEKICQDASEFYAGKEVDFDEISRHYDASVDYMDDRLGEFFDFLKKEGLWEDTLIVVTADHGQMLGEEDHYGHQYSVHEKLVSVPLIVKGADSSEEQVELRELYDLIPGWVGIEDEKIPGTDAALGGYDFPEMQVNRIPGSQRDRLYRRFKFARRKDRKSVETETEAGEKNIETFDLETDEEVEDGELEEELEKIDYRGSSGESIDEKDEEIKEKLEALGYG
jgi:arylsulfatase A-like enzyme